MSNNLQRSGTAKEDWEEETDERAPEGQTSASYKARYPHTSYLGADGKDYECRQKVILYDDDTVYWEVRRPIYRMMLDRIVKEKLRGKSRGITRPRQRKKAKGQPKKKKNISQILRHAFVCVVLSTLDVCFS